MFGIGSMRQRLYLQQESRTGDTGGGNELAWTTLRILWAQVEPVSGQEKTSDGRLQDMTLYRIRTRYAADITPAMRLMWGERILNIRHVQDKGGKQRMLEILAQEGGAT